MNVGPLTPVYGQSCAGRQLMGGGHSAVKQPASRVSRQQDSPPGQSAGTRQGIWSGFSQPSFSKFWKSMHRAESGLVFRQQTWGGWQTSVPHGIAASGPPSGDGGAGVKSHLCDGPPPQHPAKKMTAPAISERTIWAPRDILIM